jgi:ABC-type branched-subunit amino acid transport system substrate-binding protein
MRRGVIAVVIALLPLSAAATWAADEVVIGAGFVLSGDFASYGTDAKLGIDLAVDEINAAGGVLGRRLRVVALGYDATRLVADAVRRAGSTDREAVRKALGATRRFEGVNGFFSYDGSGDNLEQKPNIFVMGEKGYERLTK